MIKKKKAQNHMKIVKNEKLQQFPNKSYSFPYSHLNFT